MKAKSKSYVTSAKTMYAAMSILSKNGGSMPIRMLMKEIEKTIELSDWEKSLQVSEILCYLGGFASKILSLEMTIRSHQSGWPPH